MIEEIITEYWLELKHKTKSEVTIISKDEKEPVIKRTIAKAIILYHATGDFEYIEKVLGAYRKPEDWIEWEEIEKDPKSKGVAKKKSTSNRSKK